MRLLRNTEYFHRVTTLELFTGSHVHTALVVEEIRVDLEVSFDGSVVHDFGLNLLHIALDGIGFGAEVQICLVIGLVAGLALLGASRRRNDIATRLKFASGVVLARWHAVRPAADAAVVQTAGDNAGVDPVLPRLRRLAAHAAEAARKDALAVYARKFARKCVNMRQYMRQYVCKLGLPA